MKYLKEFIIGSSYLVFAPFFYAVKQSSSNTRNYSYYTYTMIAPLWFGLLNVLSRILQQTYNLSQSQRYILISILSAISIILIAKYMKSYNFTNNEWNMYYIYIFISYLLVWNIVVYNIEKYL